MGVQDRDWYRRDSRENEQTSGPRGRSWTSHPIAVVLAVILGVVAVWSAQVAIVEWRARVAAEQIMRASNEAMRQTQLRIKQAQREAEEREERRQVAVRQQEETKAQVVAERQQAADEARRAAVAAAERKEKAWARFYRKSAHCADAATVECANEYIRAKRQFEEKYARGEL